MGLGLFRLRKREKNHCVAETVREACLKVAQGSEPFPLPDTLVFVQTLNRLVPTGNLYLHGVWEDRVGAAATRSSSGLKS